MPHLNITLFGSPLISIDGAPLNRLVDKSAALVALLALRGPTQYRQALIASLWSSSEPAKAQAALRTTIWRLKDAGLSPWLEIDRDSITLKNVGDLWVDIDEFQKNLHDSLSHPHTSDIACPACFPLLGRAIELYRGDFMSGYTPRNASGFDEWRAEFSNILRSEYLNTLERLAKGYYQHGQLGQALQITRRWLAVDPYNEVAHSLAMRIFATNGQRANAIAQYRTFTRLLDKNLSIQPSAEITALYNQVLSGKIPSTDLSTSLTTPILFLLDMDRAAELWLSHKDRMESVHSHFIQVVKEGLRYCGGQLIQQAGHQFAILFDRGHPLQCALTLHRLAAQTKWGLPEPVRVRIVLTTYTHSPAKSPLRSTEFSICQHLLNAASGGQVLLTPPATQALEVPLSTRPRDLGWYFLPGHENPVQVYELIHPNLPSTACQPLRNLSRPPINLPVQVTPFVGRQDELVQITHQLEQPECRLLNLVGPGGIGKTRLGIQAISKLINTRYDVICYVPLVSHTNPLSLHNAIAEALNLSFNNPGDQLTQLKDYLRGRRTLLLLDNFEHLLQATPFLIELLDDIPGLRILLTSRERLNLHMETIFEVHGLPIPRDPNDPDFEQFSAVQLFIQSARRVQPGFTLHREDRSHIIQICSLVDGLPLGIELSSAWVRAISCQEIALSIQHNLDFLGSSSQDIPSRHRSLRAAFDHSWNLLSEEDRRTISKLSIFSDGFSSSAAEKIANATPTMLASYVDKSFLSRQSAGRHLMPETLRTYVRQILAADSQEYERLSDAHGEYYLTYLISMLPKFAGQNGSSAIKELWSDASNIRLALNWAIDNQRWSLFYQSIDPLMTFFELQGRFREGLENSQKLLQRIENLVTEKQPHIYHSLHGWEGWFAFRSGFYQHSLEKVSLSLEFVRRQDDYAHIAYTLILLSEAHIRTGKFDLALQEIEESLAIMEQHFDPDNSLLLGIHGSGLSLYALILVLKNRLEDAQQATMMAADAFRRSGSRYGLIRLLDVQARLANKEKKFTEGLKLRLEQLAIAEEFNDRRCIASALNNLGSTASALGDFQAAVNYLVKCAQISEESGDRQSNAICNINLGYCTLQLNRPPEEALPYYKKSLTMFRAMNDTYGAFFTLRDISRAYVLAGQLDLARQHLTEASNQGIELHNPLLVLHLLPVIARLLMQTDQQTMAAQLCSLVLHHPQAEADLTKEAASLLAESSNQTGTSNESAVGSGEPTLPTFQSLMAVLNE